jgi:stearoyl-CoA desaturase (delta-9 desaturase)
VATVIFFLVHWQASVFFQSFFQHRYCAHRQFTMGKRTEKVAHFLAWFVGGSSYLTPRAYAVLHRMHHAYSDTPKDPHSPVHHPNVFKMMWRTKTIYQDLRLGRVVPEARFDGDVPSWPLLDQKLNGWGTTFTFAAGYAGIYALLGASWWMYVFLLPLHIGLGPIHGAIVNYFGHKLGYRNFDTKDASKNTLVFDVLTMGELFQNNHHRFGQSPNFGARFYEIDPCYQIMRVLGAMKLIDMSGSQKMRMPEKGKPEVVEAEEVAPITAATEIEPAE